MATASNLDVFYPPDENGRTTHRRWKLTKKMRALMTPLPDSQWGEYDTFVDLATKLSQVAKTEADEVDRRHQS